jgi:hypothetical protein
MIIEPGNSAIIELVNDTGYFQIYDRNRLEREVLSRYFGQTKYSSFHHQLNYYGFRVIGKFTRGKISPCCYVMHTGAKWDWWWRNKNKKEKHITRYDGGVDNDAVVGHDGRGLASVAASADERNDCIPR